MKLPIRAFGCFALALAPALAAVWPDQIPPFFRQSVSRPALAGDAAVWEEYGFEEAEGAVYEAAGQRYTTTAWRFRDATGSLAAYQWMRPADATSAEIVSLGVGIKDGLLMTYGNYVLRWDGRMPTEPELRFVFERLPRLEQSPRPPFIEFIPARGRLAYSERYLLGPASLEKFEPRIPPSVAAFHLGAEGQLARHNIDGHDLAMVVFNYPTPQMARERLAEFQKLPGALVKRAGPLIALILSPSDANAAEKLLANVRYQASITWNESVTEKTELQRFGEFILNVFMFIGLLLALSMAGGAAVWGMRRLVGRRSGTGNAGEPMVVLHLRDR
ncbi:MAG: hypothetical protein HY822_05915 [Acidobacteria bacterium]|nr:hypothetical protein [Acidobacteriota bacterium]